MKPLAGVRVLVTRPEAQAAPLCAALEALGAVAVRLPVLQIEAIADNSALQQVAENLAQIQKLIFISTNAVEFALPTLFAINPQLLEKTPCFAVGKSTAEALQAYHLNVKAAPPPFNSESLLTLPELQTLPNERVVIMRGEGGRELLAESLKARGAHVEYCNVYRRVLPQLEKIPEKVDIILITSSEGLKNLTILLGDCAWLRHTPLVLISERITAPDWQAPLFAARRASDEGLIQALLEWQQVNPHVR
jgi:uroporphyrinogen-III synthase